MADLDYAACCARLEPEIVLLHALVAAADLKTPVPSCGGDWDLARLVQHVGGLHRWVERLVRERAPKRIPRTELNLGLPETPAGLPAWLLAGAAPLLATLRQADPAAPMWAWGADPHVRFWARRMLHETTVHRVDAQLAQGLAPRLDAVLAADGIDEFLTNLPCAAPWTPGIANLKGLGERLALRATDAGVEWTVTLEPTGFRWARDPTPTATVRAAGAAADLYLLLWNRLALEHPRLTVTGDAPLLARFLRDADT